MKRKFEYIKFFLKTIGRIKKLWNLRCPQCSNISVLEPTIDNYPELDKVGIKFGHRCEKCNISWGSTINTKEKWWEHVNK